MALMELRRSVLFTALLVGSSLVSSSAHSATVAVIDSGVDYKHTYLNNHIWTNPDEVAGDGEDNDWNGKKDDVYGWNFAENNEYVIDYGYLGKFSKDPYTFFEIQLRMLTGQGTQADRDWVNQKRQDEAFMQELQIFGNFVHGTHVAGISANGSANKIMALKLLPTEVKKPFEKAAAQMGGSSIGDTIKDTIIRALLSQLAAGQGKALEPIGLYLKLKGAQVANCSFGTSTKAIGTLLEKILPIILRRPATPQEVEMYSAFFIQNVVDSGKQFMVDGKKTFFVMAAGNDGTDNDLLPAYPANIRRDNAITVAATQGLDKLASFSNYGVNMVDIAAPGVGIHSSIPGDEFLLVSGTSQAAPAVSNVAGQVLDANPGLNFKDLRKVLMETVDKKDFLTGKVASGGIVNGQRAVAAALLMKSGVALDAAVKTARAQVADIVAAPAFAQDVAKESFLQMPSVFKE
ncbi:S8 family serine peptidase [bacterium]|nr:S8 family serine peptidase [bacterium]